MMLWLFFNLALVIALVIGTISVMFDLLELVSDSEGFLRKTLFIVLVLTTFVFFILTLGWYGCYIIVQLAAF